MAPDEVTNQALEQATADVAAELYGLPLGEFVGARNARAKQAKADGDRDLAAAITALAKPSKVGWLTNQLVRERWADIEPLLALGAGLREATATLSGDDLRRLTRQQHQLVHALVQQAKSVAAGLGERVTDDVADGVEQTLRAALADEGLAEQLAGGQLTDRLEYAGFGGGAGDGDGPSSPARLRSVPTGAASAGARSGGQGAGKAGAGRAGAGSAGGRDSGRESAERAAQAKREADELARREAAERAAAALTAAKQAAAAADEAQAAAEAAVQDAAAQTRARAERVEALRAEVEAAVLDHAASRQAEQQARTRLTEAERAARTAARRVGAATAERDRWAPT